MAEENIDTKENGKPIGKLLFSLVTSITAVATVISGVLSLDANMRKKGNTNATVAFFAVSSVLLGAELVGGLIWQLKDKEKATSHVQNIENQAKNKTIVNSPAP